MDDDDEDNEVKVRVLRTASGDRIDISTWQTIKKQSEMLFVRGRISIQRCGRDTN